MNVVNAFGIKVMPSHSFHPNVSLRRQRSGYVAGINR